MNDLQFATLSFAGHRMQGNPYEPPKSPTHTPPKPKSPTGRLTFFVVSVIVMAIIGSILGAWVGTAEALQQTIFELSDINARDSAFFGLLWGSPCGCIAASCFWFRKKHVTPAIVASLVLSFFVSAVALFIFVGRIAAV